MVYLTCIWERMWVGNLRTIMQKLVLTNTSVWRAIDTRSGEEVPVLPAFESRNVSFKRVSLRDTIVGKICQSWSRSSADQR
jgi:hypothetical protein